jgi:segregation and condensation protein B
MNNELIKKIEVILFYMAEPVDIIFLAKTLEVKKEEIEGVVSSLKESLESRGVRVLLHDKQVSLVTAPEYSGLIEKIIKEERERDLGRAGIEALSIIAYKGPVTKKEIEYIRGVNSQYALRSLLLRGLVEKKSIESDPRMIGYNITTDALRFLGLGQVSDLPEYTELKKQLEVKEDVEMEDEPIQ